MARAPSVLVHNWHLKLSALGLSIFLWALVQTEPLSQETFSAVPVLVEVEDTAWTLARSPSPAVVELRLGGPAREIIRLAREGTSLVVPVTSVGSRDSLVTLQREWVQLGQRAGVSVESVSPLMVNLAFEPAASRTIPVAIRVRGELPTDLALSSDLGITPRSVHVRGPESRLQGLDSLLLTPFDLAQVRESGTFEVAVDTAGLGGASIEPPEVTLGVRVEPMEERTLDAVPVVAELRGGEVAVEPAAVQVRLSGARTLVTAMDLSLLRVSVASESLRGLRAGEARLVRLEVDGLPPLLTAHLSTDAVTVRLADTGARTQQRNRP